MKRIVKNIICCFLIALLIGSMVFTVYFAKKNLASTNNPTQQMQPGNGEQMQDSTNTPTSDSNMQTPPDMSDGQSGNTTNGDTTTPPAKPDGDTSNTTTGDSNMQTPPDMPDGQSGNTTNGDTTTPPAKPDGENSNSEAVGTNTTSDTNMNTNDSNMQMGMPSGDGNAPEMPNNQTSVTLTTVYIVIIGAESLLLSATVIYLIQSKFNKKKFKETYSSSDKVVILILATIVFTGSLTFGTTYVTNKYILNDSNTTSENNANSGNQNSGSTNVTYSSATEITESTTLSKKDYESTTADENALSVTGDIEVTASDISVTKTGDSDGGDNTSFYGTNAAIIAKGGATLNLKNITVTTDATGANGVFSYGGSATTNNSSSDNTTINISDSTITTKKDNSGGIMTTGGGITNATNLTVETAGTSSAAIRSDRGGGTVTVDGGSYKTTGQGSPTIYSTADITVKDAELTATASEGIVIEGKNSVAIEDTKLTDTNSKLNGQSTTYKNIFLYQSMSGDADDGLSEFSAKNSTIITNKGDSFYVTNTTAKISLTNNTITNNDSTGNFLRVQADSWGTSGSNGGIVTLIMNNQDVDGNIVVDSISTLDMTMTKSTFVGTINGDNSAKSITLTLDKKSTIKLTGDSYITSLDNADSTNSNIDFNGYKLYVNGKAIN